MEEIVNLTALEGSVDFSMMGMFLKSDWVVKFVIILLVIFSIQSWKTIIQKILLINKIKKISKKLKIIFGPVSLWMSFTNKLMISIKKAFQIFLEIL